MANLCRVAAVVSAVLAVLAGATSTVPFVAETGTLPWSTLFFNEGVYTVADGYLAEDGAVGFAQYNASLYDLGWDFFRYVASNESLPEQLPLAYFGAGYLEGYLTSQRITGQGFWRPGASTMRWIQSHLDYMYQMSGANAGDPFWDQVGLQLRQIEGLAAGYNNASNANKTTMDFFLISFGSEIGDVNIAVDLLEGRLQHNTLLDRKGFSAHCSALIKVTADDLFMAHDTWNGFYGLQWRQYKVYTFQTTVTMSSYVANIASGDDWYMTSQELTVQETTNIVWNTSLYTAVVPETVSEFMRVMVANYLASSGEEWTGYFARHNSGTYNNQYMVVDMKLYVPGATLVPGTLWIAEQIPGMVVRGDETNVLSSQSYWASYNIPYYWTIYQISGYAQVEQQQGTFWSYTSYARPEIFRRNNSAITDVAQVMRMMRYNNYRHDPLSLIPNCTGASENTCNPAHSSMLSIASRGDLMPVYSTTAENMAHYGPLYSWVAQGCFGAVDSKIASYKNRRSLTGYLISGPTNDQQPTFRWGENANCGSKPPGCVESFDFPWVKYVLS